MGSRPRKVGRRESQNKKHVFNVERISVFLLTADFVCLFEASLDNVVFQMCVAKVSEMEAPWDNFSKAFVEKLER